MGPGELLRRVVDALREIEVPYFVTGATATIAYGEPRLTNDIDVVVRLGSARIEAFCEQFDPDEFYLDEEAVSRAVESRASFNLIHPSSGLKVDFMVADESPYDESRFERAREITIGEGDRAYFAAPEDVILKKLEYYQLGGSEKHLRDIAGILRVSGGELDRELIAGWAERLGLVGEWELASRGAS